MLNYVLSMASNFLKKTSSLLSSLPPSSAPCLIPGQNATNATCPVKNQTAIALDEEQCLINYPSTADIAQCMQDCFDCCSNTTRKAVKDLIITLQADYFQCDRPPAPPAPGSASSEKINLDALIPLIIFGVISGLITIHFFYKTFEENGITHNRVALFVVSGLVTASLLGGGFGVLGLELSGSQTVGALSGLVASLTTLGLIQTGRANIKGRVAAIAYQNAGHGQQGAINDAAPLLGDREPLTCPQFNCPDLRGLCL